MIDSQLAGTGNSRFLKSVADFKAKYPTYDAFVNALVAGTLPIDLNGVNPEGWTQQGTPLNKATLLSDGTAAKIGVADNATVDGALDKLFTFADDGKKACASAVSKMGVQTADTATFETIAANIGKIETGSDVSGVTATQADVRNTVQFVQKDGTLVPGTMGTFTLSDPITPRTTDQRFQGRRYMNMDWLTVKGDPNLSSENIVDGANIFGVPGNAPNVRMLKVFDVPTFTAGNQKLHITFDEYIVPGEYLSGFVTFSVRGSSCVIMFNNCKIQDGLAGVNISVKIGNGSYIGYTVSFFTSGYMEIDISKSDLGFTPDAVTAYLIESKTKY